ncbi:MAG: adenylyl-sulfate kinase [Dokdonella sp.]
MAVIWITGLPGVGKTATAGLLCRQLRARGEACVLLDGDSLRLALATLGGGYDFESRRRLAHAYSELASLLEAQELTVIIATVSLLHEIHAENRRRFADYMEVLLICDEKTRLQRRMLHGLQVGVQVEAQFPPAPDLTLHSDAALPDEIALAIAQRWQGRHER